MPQNSILYGPDGRPAQLAEQDRFEEVMGAYDGYQAASFRLAPFHPDAFICSRGWSTLEDMLNMAAVRAPLGLIRDAVLYKGWRVEPAITDQADANYKEAAELASALEYCLHNIEDEAGNVSDFRQDLYEMLYAVHTGFRVSEIVWRVLEEGPWAGKLGFAQFSHKPCKQIGFDLNPRTMAVKNITSYTPLEGFQYNVPVEKVLRYTFAPKDSLPYGSGIGRVVYKHSWSLDFLYRFWNIALETFGSPFILGKAPVQSIKLARDIIQQIRQGAPAVLPSGVEADLVEATGSSLQAFKAAAEHHSQQIAYGYLYNTLSTGEGQRSGSLALGKVHQDSQEYGLGGRRQDVENVLMRQLVRRWVRYNYGPEALGLAPRVTLGDWNEEDMDKLSSAFERLLKARVLHPAEPQIRERLGLSPASPEIREMLERYWSASEGPSTVPSSEGDDTTDQDDPEPTDDPSEGDDDNNED